MVGRRDRSRPGCTGPRAAVRRGADRRVARRSVCRGGHDGSAVRPRGRLDARSRDPLPHLLFGVLHRCPWTGRSATCVGSPFPASRRRPTGWWRWVRHRTAVVRPVRDDGPRRVDRRGVAALHHRTGQHPRQRDLRVGAREQRRRHPRPVHRVPDSQRTGRKRRQRHLVRPVRRTGRVRHQSARRVHAARSALPRLPVARACTAARSAARRAHRPLPPKRAFARQDERASRECHFGGAVVRGPAGSRT